MTVSFRFVPRAHGGLLFRLLTLIVWLALSSKIGSTSLFAAKPVSGNPNGSTCYVLAGEGGTGLGADDEYLVELVTAEGTFAVTDKSSQGYTVIFSANPGDTLRYKYWNTECRVCSHTGLSVNRFGIPLHSLLQPLSAEYQEYPEPSAEYPNWTTDCFEHACAFEPDAPTVTNPIRPVGVCQYVRNGQVDCPFVLELALPDAGTFNNDLHVGSVELFPAAVGTATEIGGSIPFRANLSGHASNCGTVFEWRAEEYRLNGDFRRVLGSGTLPLDVTSSSLRSVLGSVNLPMDAGCGGNVRVFARVLVPALGIVSPFQASEEFRLWKSPSIQLVEPSFVGEGGLRETRMDICNPDLHAPATLNLCGCRAYNQAPGALNMTLDPDFSGDSSKVYFDLQLSSGGIAACGEKEMRIVPRPTVQVPFPPLSYETRIVATDIDDVSVFTEKFRVRAGYQFAVSVQTVPQESAVRVFAPDTAVFEPRTRDFASDGTAIFQRLDSVESEVRISTAKQCYEPFPGVPGPRNPYLSLIGDAQVVGDCERSLVRTVPICGTWSEPISLVPREMIFRGRVILGSRFNDLPKVVPEPVQPVPACVPGAEPLPTATPDASCSLPPDKRAEGAPMCGAIVMLADGDGKVVQEAGVTVQTVSDGTGLFELRYRPTGISAAQYRVVAVYEGLESVMKGDAISTSPCDGHPAPVIVELFGERDECSVANPVDPISGEKSLSVSEFSAPGPAGFGFSLVRHYRTRLPLREGPFGWGWTHNWDVRLSPARDGYRVDFEDGLDHLLVPDEGNAGAYRGIAGFPYTMANVDGRWVLSAVDGTAYYFNLSLRLYKVVDRFGNRIELAYDSQQRVAGITDAVGRSYTFTYHPGSNRIASFIAPNAGQGGTWIYTYDDGDLTGVSGPGPGTHSYIATYTYDSAHRMTSKDDPKGGHGRRQLTYVYDAMGRVQEERRQPGNHLALKLEYGFGGENTRVTEDGQVSLLAVGSGMRSASRRPEGVPAPTPAVFDPFNRGRTHTYDLRGNESRVEYLPGNSGLIRRSVSPDRLETTYTYGPNGRVQSRVEKDLDTGVTRSYSETLDALSRPQSVDDNGRITEYRYHASGRGEWTRREGPDGGVTERSFYPNGLLEREALITAGLSTRYTYDAWGRVKTVTNEVSGQVSTHTYDGFGNVVRTDHQDAHGSTFTRAIYDAANRLEFRFDEEGNQVGYEYSNDGRDLMERETGPGGAYVRDPQYDSITNQMTLETLSGPDPAGGSFSRVTEYRYVQAGCNCGDQGRLERVIQRGALVNGVAVDVETRYEYDVDGNREKVIGPGPMVTRYEYDGANRVTATITGDQDPVLRRKVEYTYDAFGNRRTLTDGKVQTTTFTYTPHQELESEAPPSGPAIIFGYDDAGRLNSRSNRRSGFTPWSASYDHAGRQLTEGYPNAQGAPISLGWRYGSPADQTDQLVRLNDPVQPLDFKYQHRGRAKEKAFPSQQRRLQYQFDDAGRQTRLTLVDLQGGPAKTQNYEYDEAGRQTKAEDWGGGYVSKKYLPDGQVRIAEHFLKQPDGSVKKRVHALHRYDESGRLLGITYTQNTLSGPVLARVDYEYDLAGNRTQRKTLASSASYTPNSLNELASEANSADLRGSKSFQYDKAGNRSATVYPNQTQSFSYPNNLNRLTQAGADAFVHDEEGNLQTQSVNPNAFLKNAGSYGYIWDGKNRLSQVTLPDSSVVTYTYSQSNHRIRREHNGEIRDYLYDGNKLIEERVNGQRLWIYSWTSEGLQSRTHADGRTETYLWDALGSALAIVNEQGDILQTYEYDAWGLNLAGKDVTNDFQFVGRFGGMQDELTGLTYFWNRWYDAHTGRWASEDPIRQAGGVNLFGYVGNRPTNSIDPRGLIPTTLKREGSLSASRGLLGALITSNRFNVSVLDEGGNVLSGDDAGSVTSVKEELEIIEGREFVNDIVYYPWRLFFSSKTFSLSTPGRYSDYYQLPVSNPQAGKKVKVKQSITLSPCQKKGTNIIEIGYDEFGGASISDSYDPNGIPLE